MMDCESLPSVAASFPSSPPAREREKVQSSRPVYGARARGETRNSQRMRCARRTALTYYPVRALEVRGCVPTLFT